EMLLLSPFQYPQLSKLAHQQISLNALAEISAMREPASVSKSQESAFRESHSLPRQPRCNLRRGTARPFRPGRNPKSRTLDVSSSSKSLGANLPASKARHCRFRHLPDNHVIVTDKRKSHPNAI